MSAEEKAKEWRTRESIRIMRNKFISRQRIDPVRQLDKLGIDLIIKNQDLYDMFQSRVSSMIRKDRETYAS